MSKLNFCGFETADTSECRLIGGTLSVQSSTAHSGAGLGAYTMRCNPTTSALGWFEIEGINQNGTNATIATIETTTSIFTQFYFNYATKPSTNDEPIYRVMGPSGKSNVQMIEVRLNSSGKLTAYDTNGTLLATGTTVLSANTWYRIAIKVLSGNPGTYEVQINGTSEFSASNANLSTANVQNLYFGKSSNRNSNTVDFFFDDVVIDDAT